MIITSSLVEPKLAAKVDGGTGSAASSEIVVDSAGLITGTGEAKAALVCGAALSSGTPRGVSKSSCVFTSSSFLGRPVPKTGNAGGGESNK